MRKLFLALVFGILILGLVSAESVAYVVKSEINVKQPIIDVLEDAGHDVDMIYASQLNSVVWENYGVIVVNNEKFGSDAVKIPVNNIGSVVLDTNTADISAWKWANGVGRLISTIQPKSVPLWQNPPHELANGLDNPLLTYNLVPLSSSDYSLYYIKGVDKAAGLKYVYVDNINFNGPTPINGGVILAIGEESLLRDGTRTNARGVFFGIPRADLWTEETKEVFLTSVDWVITNRDEDGDGYNSNVDCDDSDSSVWVSVEGYLDSDGDGYGSGELVQLCSDGNLPIGYSEIDGDCDDNDSLVWANVEGYLDSDEDGYGSGELVQLCSDGNLPIGYSEIDGDCNDSNEEVNPGMEEIAYDGLDNDCSEGDLRDYDGDGYDSVLVGGDDCDDNDSSVYPGAEDASKDCNNNGPIQTNVIPNLEWNEDEVKFLNLNNYFLSRDGLELYYNLSNTSEDNSMTMEWVNGGTVVFLGEENWYGEDWIEFEVKDENNNTLISNRVILEILSVNDAPQFNGEIQDYDLSESNNWSELINLSLYFSDVDSDLIYNVEGNVDFNILIEGEMVSVSYDEEYLGLENIKIIASDGEYEAESNEFELLVREIGIPVISIISPLDNQTIEDSRNVDFVLRVEDEDNSEVECRLIINDENVSVKNVIVGENENIILEDIENGEYIWKYVCSDGENIVESETREFVMSYFDYAPVVEIISPNNNSLFNISRVDLKWRVDDDRTNNIECLVKWGDSLREGIVDVTNGESKEINVVSGIEKLYTLNNLDNGDYYYSIECYDGVQWSENNEIRGFSIDVPPVLHAPVLKFIEDKKVKTNELLEFELIALDANENDSFVYSASNLPNGAVLESNMFRWTPLNGQERNYTIQFKVTDSSGLTNVKASKIEVYSEEINETPQNREIEFSDAEQCKLFDENIIVDIRKPKNNEDFEILEEIEIDIEIENKGSVDVDLDVRAYLYDMTEGEVVEEIEDDIEVDEGDEERIELTIKIPSKDIDSDNEYYIYVIAMEEDNEFCNSGYVEIEIEKEKHKIEIESVDVERNQLSTGEMARIEIRLDNIGEEDEDVYIEIKNSELGINYRSEEFELDSEDSTRKKIEFIIPSEAEEKSYLFDVIVIYDEEESASFSLDIMGRDNGTTGFDGFVNNVIKLREKSKSTIDGMVVFGEEKENEFILETDLKKSELESKKSSVKISWEDYQWMLIAGILILLILIVLVIIVRMR